MTGRAEVERLKQVLDATFNRVPGGETDLELLSDFARYLCVLTSGFLEQAVIALVLEHSRVNASPTVQRYVEFQLRRLTNTNAQRLIELLGSFDPDWRRDLVAYLVDERKDAVDSVINLRNTISHGRFAGLTMARVRNYYDRVKEVVDHIADLCDPP